MMRTTKYKRPPEVSVIIPVFNGSAFIEAAIESVLQQTWSDFEIVVVDNASTDDTLQRANRFRDSRLRIVSESEFLPIFGNFNRGIRYAEGKYLKFLCADDLLFSNALQMGIDHMERFPDVGIFTADRTAINGRGEFLGTFGHGVPDGLVDGRSALELVARLRNYIGEPSAVLLRKQEVVEFGGFNESFRQLGDLDLWCRILSKYDLYYCALPLSAYRIHSEQLTWKNTRHRLSAFSEDFRISRILSVQGIKNYWLFRFGRWVQRLKSRPQNLIHRERFLSNR